MFDCLCEVFFVNDDISYVKLIAARSHRVSC